MTRRVVKSVKIDRNGPKNGRKASTLKIALRARPGRGRPDFTAAGPACNGNVSELYISEAWRNSLLMSSSNLVLKAS
jgi:hypothetical protein